MTAVAELTGVDLALWVARALRLDDACIAFDICRVGKRCTPQRIDFEPHEDWAQGGPLIDQFNVMFEVAAEVYDASYYAYLEGIASTAEKPFPLGQYGETRLIAACRAIVESVYGSSVPDEVAL
jgi:Protein of unknown function (DUF2591)